MIATKWWEIHHYSDDGSLSVRKVQTKAEAKRYVKVYDEMGPMPSGEFVLVFKARQRIDGAVCWDLDGALVNCGYKVEPCPTLSGDGCKFVVVPISGDCEDQ